MILFLGIKLYAQENCAPLLKDIFKYEIGDQFTYICKGYSWDGESCLPCITEYYQSFEVVNKEIREDTLLYVIDGFFPPNMAAQIHYNPSIEETYVDTLVLVDTSSNFLNFSADSLMLYDFGELNFGDQDIYSKVIIEDADTILYKGIGGADNQYVYRDDELEFFGDFIYEEKYATGLGLIYRSFFLFEGRSLVKLASYIKGGDTTKLVLPVEQITDDGEISIYPNPVTESITISCKQIMKIESIRIINMLGREVYFYKPKTGELQYTIDLKELYSGTYIMVLEMGNNKVQKKFIKT